jgi:L-arabinose transport system permease protein
LLLNKTTFGRNTLAIGGNEEAARLAGVPVVRTKIIIFRALRPGFCRRGDYSGSRMTSGQPMTSIGYELIVISACVLGGVSLKGGIGKISYVVAGILILGTVENAMNLLNISPFSQYVVRGVILLAAVIFDRYKQKAKRAADSQPFSLILIIASARFAGDSYQKWRAGHTVYTYMANNPLTTSVGWP